jgi:hypothetical protein
MWLLSTTKLAPDKREKYVNSIWILYSLGYGSQLYHFVSIFPLLRNVTGYILLCRLRKNKYVIQFKVNVI